MWPGDKHVTEAKKLEQAIRARSARTGESYTAARLQVLNARRKRDPQRTEPTPTKPPRPVAAQPGLSEKAVVEKTGHGLDAVLAGLRATARKKWLAGADPALRRALDGALAPGAKGVVRGAKRARVRYRWDATQVELVFEPRGTGTSVVAANTRLKDAAQVAERRAQWRAALDALKTHLMP